MSMDLINSYKKKFSHPIVHLDIEINLAILAAILWLNIPGNGGIISGCCVLVIMLLYLFVAFNENSRFNMWLDEVAHKINMRSLIKARKDKLYGWIFLSIGFLDFLVFYLFYYLAELPILACFCMIVGQILKFTGLVKLYLGAKTIKGERIIFWIILLSLGLYNSQIGYYMVLIFTHLKPG